jgi:hypothetical protein
MTNASNVSSVLASTVIAVANNNNVFLNILKNLFL